MGRPVVLPLVVLSYTTPEEFAAREAQTRADNRAAMEAIALGDMAKAASIFPGAKETMDGLPQAADTFAGRMESARSRMAMAEEFLESTKEVTGGATPKPPPTAGTVQSY